MIKTKMMAMLGMLMALYVVLSAFLKFTIVGNIMVDLGYAAYAYALCLFGVFGIPVGVVGCALESILYSAYGFSISWCAANLCIGLICGIGFSKTKNLTVRAAITIIAVAVGMIVVKTAIECCLYHIPLAVKIPKNIVAFVTDTVVMFIGLVLYDRTKHIRLVSDCVD